MMWKLAVLVAAIGACDPVTSSSTVDPEPVTTDCVGGVVYEGGFPVHEGGFPVPCEVPDPCAGGVCGGESPVTSMPDGCEGGVTVVGGVPCP